MKRSLTSALCLCIILSLLTSATACSVKPGSSDAQSSGRNGEEQLSDEESELVGITDELCAAIISTDLYEIEYMSDEVFYSVRGAWETRLNFSSNSSYDPRSTDVYDTIIDTFDYEIDPGSATVSDTTASINVTFSMTDWEAVIEGDLPSGPNSLTDALQSADTREIPCTLEFINDNGVWLCSNTEDILTDIYSFVDEDFLFGSPVADMLSGYSWKGNNCIDENAGIYSHTVYIQVDFYLENYFTYDENTFYCEISHNGDLIKTDHQGSMAELDFSDTGSTDELEIPEGMYTFAFYDEDGKEIITLTATVINDESDYGYEDRHVWYYTDNVSDYGYNDQSPMYVAPDVIECEPVADVTDWNFSGYYTVEYEGNIIFTESGFLRASITPSSGPDMPLDSTGAHFAPGVYTVTYYDENGNQLSTDSCTVYEEGTFAVAEHLRWGFNEWDYDTDQAYFDRTGIMQAEMSYVGDLDESSVTCTMYYNDTEIYSGPGTCIVIGTSTYDYIPEIALMQSYFDDGIYTFTFTDDEGNILQSESCYVINGYN